MKSTKKLSFLQYFTLFLLVAAVAVILPSCGDKDKDEGNAQTVTITVEVVGPDGTSNEHVITTSASTLAEAITSEGIVTGEDGEYGLYIKTADGITADYDTDGAYWGLYKNGEYLMTGASATPIADGEHYEIVYEVYAG